MQVTSTTGASNAASGTTTTKTSAAAAAQTQVDYNSFLKLMIAELKNQDPTKPTDPTQYMSQLASFSAVGQSVQTNQKLDVMLTTTALAQANSAIGRTATSADGATSGTVKSVSIGSDGNVTATLQNGNKLPLGSGVTIS